MSLNRLQENAYSAFPTGREYQAVISMPLLRITSEDIVLGSAPVWYQSQGEGSAAVKDLCGRGCEVARRNQTIFTEAAYRPSGCIAPDTCGVVCDTRLLRPLAVSGAVYAAYAARPYLPCDTWPMKNTVYSACTRQHFYPASCFLSVHTMTAIHRSFLMLESMSSADNTLCFNNHFPSRCGLLLKSYQICLIPCSSKNDLKNGIGHHEGSR